LGQREDETRVLCYKIKYHWHKRKLSKEIDIDGALMVEAIEIYDDTYDLEKM